MDAALLIARIVLAAVFAVAAIGKLADLAGSREAAASFGAPRAVATVLGTALPFVELAIAVALCFAGTARGAALAALVLLLAFSGAIVTSIARGEAPECHCFGQVHSEPAGPRALARNLALAALAAFAALAGSDPGPGLGDALGDLSTAGALALAATVVLFGLLALGGAAFLSLLRRYGALLLRLERLEEALRSDGIEVAAQSEPHPGLPVGSEAPEFALPGLRGEVRTLASLRAPELPVLLVFTDPACGPCRALLPAIGAWQRERVGELAVAVISRGAPEASRVEAGEHGLTTVLFESDAEVSNAYEGRVTPSAVLVDAEGRIASPVVAGQPEIERLAGSVLARALAVHRRSGQAPPPSIATGDPLPALELTDLDGAATSLGTALAGRDRVLLLWDPACGFCRRMLDDLRRIEGEGGDSLLLLSRGDPDANRELGLGAPILFERETFALGRATGAPGTPSALAVGGDGRLRAAPAVGAEAVLELLRSEAERRSVA